MSKWKIAKEFDFCYGHRVWSQELDADLSCNAPCKCRHLHGHQGKVIIHLESETLNERGMIIDFNELNWFKKWLDDTLDHKMIMDISDPAIELFPVIANAKDEGWFIDIGYGAWTIRPKYYEDTAVPEIYEGLVLVDFVPTSENLSAWFFEIVQDKLLDIATVESVQFYETPKSQSVYTN